MKNTVITKKIHLQFISTGAGSGIGRAACQVLSKEGATVIAADRNYEAAVQTIKTHTALAPGTNGL